MHFPLFLFVTQCTFGGGLGKPPNKTLSIKSSILANNKLEYSTCECPGKEVICRLSDRHTATARGFRSQD